MHAIRVNAGRVGPEVQRRVASWPVAALVGAMLLWAWAGDGALARAPLRAPGTTPSAAVPDGLPAPVRQALGKAGVPADAMAALVAPVDGDLPPVLGWNASQPMNPASVMKLVTTWAAIDLLGPDFTWRTTFYVDGPVSAGLLRGNLYIRGGGDPKFVMERITAALQAVHDLGVTVIRGDIVLDGSAFQVPPVDPAAFDGERLRPYNAAPEALLVNFKSLILNFTPDAAAGVARVAFEPPLAGVQVPATVPLSGQGCGDWRSSLQARLDDPNAVGFAGRYPASCGERTWPVAYVAPESFAARAIEGLWRASGGLLTGSVHPGTVPASAAVVYEAPSLPLAEVVTDINKFSNNLMAQQVFLTLGRLDAGLIDQREGQMQPAALASAPPATFERSRALLARWWQNRLGGQASAPLLENGAGLSRQERISAQALLALLRLAAHHPQGAVLAQSLPVAGVDGTAAHMGQRGVIQAALGNARIKTGSLRDVVAVAGYVQSRSGRPLVVVGIVNHVNAPQARPALDALLEWAATSGLAYAPAPAATR